MSIILLLLGATVGFALGAVLGAPYLRTHSQQAEAALDLLDLKPGQTLVDLGSGDGAVLQAAANRGIRAIGYEINPCLYIWSKLRCRHHKDRVEIHLKNYWRAPLPECDGIFVFLIGRYMAKLDRKLIRELKEPTKVASYVFQIPAKEPIAVQNGVYIYEYKKIDK